MVSDVGLRHLVIVDRLWWFQQLESSRENCEPSPKQLYLTQLWF